MLIAEDLVLLVLEDISGRPVSGLNASTLDLLAGGALVSELTLSSAVHLQRDPRDRPVGGAPDRGRGAPGSVAPALPHLRQR